MAHRRELGASPVGSADGRPVELWWGCSAVRLSEIFGMIIGMIKRSRPKRETAALRDRERNRLAFEAAMRAFHKGPPGVVRSVACNDSTPPDYEPLPTTVMEERQAIRDAIDAYLEASAQMLEGSGDR